MQLEEAMLRDLITDERVPDEPTFRFRHVLIRDVAYATLPKARRATLHRAVADWLRSWAGSRIDEFVEIEAYHLEQSVQLQRELALGESLDPEIVRGVVGDFFELARAEIERRGGAVEKFSGDAVMAIFGLPQAHEDDPERAVRAAVAIRDGLGVVAVQARERHGIDVRARIGIESGEVVVGDPFGGATMATGDAMNLAARLEQQAEPGEIVVGAMAYASVRDIVDGAPLGELQLRGHEAALHGWRVDRALPTRSAVRAASRDCMHH